MSDRPLFWSDQLAFGITQKFPEIETYVCASGISPSGLVHAGNFREIITTNFVVKSLQNRGEDARFIYSWDDFDRFRKVPSNVPDEFEQYIGLPLVDVPDPEGCHESYAEHFEARLEEELEGMHMEIEFIQQSKKFRNGDYTEQIKTAMQKRNEIKKILDKYRREPLEQPYYPLRVYCKECGKDFTEVTDYDGEYTIEYYCEECEDENELNFKDNPSVKLPWRIDWPMRWDYEGVDFEPAGKEHSASGGSRDTGNEVSEKIFDKEPPVHQMYEFVTKDGRKISSSSGEDVFTISELKKVYSPEIIRFLFSNTKPNKAFEIPFEDEEIFQRYEKFDEIEHQYFNPDELDNERERKHRKRVYEIAMVNTPEEEPVRVPFKQASFVSQTVPEERWATKGFESLRRTGHLPEELSEEDKDRTVDRLRRARNWARDYAPEDYVYSINFQIGKELREDLSEEEKEAGKKLAEMLDTETWENQEDLDGKIFDVKEETELGTGDFFTAIYKILLSREQGPRLSRLLISIGAKESAEILRQVR
ncbi:MAG: lysine--tRNA ligase [Candidatus Nanohaloarchaea archaeon]